jgi:DnaJ-class molecular chaperone
MAKLTCLLVVLLSLLAFQARAEESLYDILEVPIDSTEQQIKKAFRKLSIKWHPDKNPGDDEASHRFTEINRANEILSDKDKRAVYDSSGIDGVKKFERGDYHVNRGKDQVSNINVSLEDLYLGTSRSLTLRKNELCPKCRGTGAKDAEMKTCKKCKGRGQVKQKMNMGFMQMDVMADCDACGGKGKTPKQTCPHCSGRKVMAVSKNIEVIVEKGMSH